MRVFVRTVTLLIGVILANCEIDVTLTDATQDVENTDASSDDRNSRLSTDDSSNEWKEKEPLVMGEIFEERIDPNRQTDATDERVKNEYPEGHPEYDRRIDLDSDSRGISKRRESLDTWLDLAAKSKELRNSPPSSTITPWIYRWGNKRKEDTDGSSVRLIRAPFNSWGGKRGSMTFPVVPENLYDRYGRDLSVDGNDVKKKAEDIKKVGWKVPFNSWGGKRTEKLNDRQRYPTYLKERIYHTPARHVHKVHESTKGRNNDDKGNDNFLYRIPYHLHNETSQDDSSTSNDGWLMPIPEKRMIHKICKKTVFNPWGGKRSFKSDSIRSRLILYSPATKTFLCCYPIEESK